MDLMPPFPGARALIALHNASVTLHGVRALDQVSCTVHEGEHLVLRGGNGAGKSTLLRVLRGEQWLDAEEQAAETAGGGNVVWMPHGEAETSPLAGRAMTALVSAAQQERALSQGWDICGEDLIFGGLTDAVYVLRPAVGEDREQILAVAGWLGIEALLSRRVPEFSQGELRIMLVARALVRNPAVLLLDEVTDGLDAAARGRLLDVLERVANVATLVISTHRPETLPGWMRREIRLLRGRVLADGPAGQLSAETEIRLSSPVGALPALTSTQSDPHGVPALRPSTLPSVTNLLGARSEPVAGETVSREAEFRGARIVITNADVFVERHRVLHNLNWTIEPGENWAVVGGNGAGKSTLLRLLAGDEIPAFGGSVQRFLPPDGREVLDLETLRQHIRLVSDHQQATYGYNLCGEDLVLSGAGNTVGLYRTATEPEIAEARECLALMGVQHLGKRSIRHCSTGELRRLLLARALMGRPALLLLDEPCSGLDPAARHQLLTLVEALRIQFVLVTHHDQDIPASVTRVLRLEKAPEPADVVPKDTSFL